MSLDEKISRSLGPLLVHSAFLHPFKANSHAALLDLALLLLLGVLEVFAMAELHEMAGLVDLALETAEGLLDALAFAHIDLDGDGQRSGGGEGGGGCNDCAMDKKEKKLGELRFV